MGQRIMKTALIVVGVGIGAAVLAAGLTAMSGTLFDKAVTSAQTRLQTLLLRDVSGGNGSAAVAGTWNRDRNLLANYFIKTMQRAA
jgi:hypothetical protein